jgi:hypothetical protein
MLRAVISEPCLVQIFGLLVSSNYYYSSCNLLITARDAGADSCTKQPLQSVAYTLHERQANINSQLHAHCRSDKNRQNRKIKIKERERKFLTLTQSCLLGSESFITLVAEMCVLSLDIQSQV